MENDIPHADKLAWMADWCRSRGLSLSLDGTVGFARPCVGVSHEDGQCYPDYHWYDSRTYERLDRNGEVWTPPNAYHKHPCVAVLGQGESAEAELYDWLRWFDREGFTLEVKKTTLPLSPLEMLMGRAHTVRLVRTG